MSRTKAEAVQILKKAGWTNEEIDATLVVQVLRAAGWTNEEIDAALFNGVFLCHHDENT